MINLSQIDSANFEETALRIFKRQYERNIIYRQYCELLKVNPEKVTSIYQIPFLPISFFKSFKVISGNEQPQIIFKSSGTANTGLRSTHYVTDLQLYKDSFLNCFELFYGSKNNPPILALLPNYQEQGDSSLVYMVDQLIAQQRSSYSNFYHESGSDLYKVLIELENKKLPAILIGVTYSLLNFAEKYPLKLSSTIVMETGGMKGRRKELTRSQVHEQLMNAFQCDTIHSEYGMTELLSQAYSTAKGIFRSPPWMQFFTRDIYEPLSVLPVGERGAINVIDLANINSCCFIATDDIGCCYADKSFEIFGRLDNSDIRGCNLLMEN